MQTWSSRFRHRATPPAYRAPCHDSLLLARSLGIRLSPIILPDARIEDNISMKMDSNDIIHLVFTGRQGTDDMALIHMTVNTATDVYTSTVVDDSGYIGGSHAIELQIDSNDYPHLVHHWASGWPDYLDSSDYWYKDGTGWHKEVISAAVLDHHATEWNQAFCLDSNNAPHVFVNDNATEYIKHYYKSGTWTSENVNTDSMSYGYRNFFAACAIGTDLYLKTSGDGKYYGQLHQNTGSGWSSASIGGTGYNDYDYGEMGGLFADSSDDLYTMGIISTSGYHAWINLWDNKLGSWRKTEVVHFYDGSDEFDIEPYAFDVTAAGVLGCIYSQYNGTKGVYYFSGAVPSFSTPALIPGVNDDYNNLGFAFDSNGDPWGCYLDPDEGLIILSPTDFP